MAGIVCAALEQDPASRPLPAEIVETLHQVLEAQPHGGPAGGFKLRS